MFIQSLTTALRGFGAEISRNVDKYYSAPIRPMVYLLLAAILAGGSVNSVASQVKEPPCYREINKLYLACSTECDLFSASQREMCLDEPIRYEEPKWLALCLETVDFNHRACLDKCEQLYPLKIRLLCPGLPPPPPPPPPPHH